MLWLLVNIRFQVLFHSPPGVLFTFPSRYCFTIGHQVVFRLGGWSPLLPTGFHVSGGTLDSARYLKISFTGLLPSLACRPRQFYYLLVILNAVRNPDGITTIGLASSRFARRYFGNLFWFLFLRLLRCFSSAGLSPYNYEFIIRYYSIAVVGFPIRISADQWIFAPPRSFSQLVTSFVVSWCQGILRMLFIAWSVLDLIVTFSVTGSLRIMWVSFFIGLRLIPLAFAFVTLFAIWKNLFFSYSFSFQFSNIIFQTFCDVWKVDSN